MSEVKKLTRAQAKWIFDELNRRAPFDLPGMTAREELETLETIIKELTYEPGEDGFCEKCEYWGYESRATYRIHNGVIQVVNDKMDWGCNHEAAKEGFCPVSEPDGD